MTDENSIEIYLQNKSKRFIINDLAASTGLSVFDARNGVDRLMAKYQCRLQVTDQGELIYDFGELERRGAKTWQESLTEIANWSWKALQYVFKIWVGVTLIVYFIVFFVILIAIIIAIFAAADGDADSGDSGSFIGDIFSGIGDVFVMAFQWNTTVETVHMVTDKQGYQYAEYDHVPSTSQKLQQKKQKNKDQEHQEIVDLSKPEEKGFISSIYDFIFGVPRVPTHNLAFQQEIAAFLREKNGIITPAELKSLNGLGATEAEKLFSDCLVRFEGKPEVAENGVLYGNFEDFTKKIAEDDSHKVIYYWDEYEPEIKLTGNTKGRNATIIGLNIFNLFFALMGMGEAYNDIFEMPDATWLIWVLGYVPFTFSSLVFVFPIIRSIYNIFPRKNRNKNNLRRRVMKVIFRNIGEDLSLDQFVQKINQTEKEEKLSAETVEEHLKNLLHDLRGEIKISEQGQAVYAFDQVRQDLRTAQKLRNQFGQRGEAGNIVFDTKE